jgi:hypothetical protein
MIDYSVVSIMLIPLALSVSFHILSLSKRLDKLEGKQK